MRKPRQHQLTIEQISQIYDMSISEVNATINVAFNKMVDELSSKHGIDIWDSVFGLKDYLGITEKEAFEKLNNKNKNLITEVAKQKYKIPG